MSEQEYRAGECFLAFVKFKQIEGGKVRPVVLIHDREDEQFFACTVTSKINNPLNKKYGYVVEDWKEAGLDKPSIIKCNRRDMFKVREPFQLLEKIGNLTPRDLEGLLAKQIKVRFMEHQKEMQKLKNEYER